MAEPNPNAARQDETTFLFVTLLFVILLGVGLLSRAPFDARAPAERATAATPCASCHPSLLTASGQPLLDASQRAWTRGRCAGCHTGSLDLPTFVGPSLEAVGDKLQREWMNRWLLEPATFDPREPAGPHYLRDGPTEDPLQHATERAFVLAHYLATRRRAPGMTVTAATNSAITLNAQSPPAAAKLLDQCQGCHAPADFIGLGSKTSGAWLRRALVEPAPIILAHSGRRSELPHPRPAWSEAERAAVAELLGKSYHPSFEARAPVPDRTLSDAIFAATEALPEHTKITERAVALGARVYTSEGCARCHQATAEDQPAAEGERLTPPSGSLLGAKPASWRAAHPRHADREDIEPLALHVWLSATPDAEARTLAPPERRAEHAAMQWFSALGCSGCHTFAALRQRTGRLSERGVSRALQRAPHDQGLTESAAGRAAIAAFIDALIPPQDGLLPSARTLDRGKALGAQLITKLALPLPLDAYRLDFILHELDRCPTPRCGLSAEDWRAVGLYARSTASGGR